MCVEGGSVWAVQVEGTAAAAGLSIVISTSALDESLGVVVVWEQATWVTVAFAVTWVCNKKKEVYCNTCDQPFKHNIKYCLLPELYFSIQVQHVYSCILYHPLRA